MILNIPNSVVSIDQAAFAINNIININFGSGLNEIGDQSFAYNRIKNLKIPNNVTSIGQASFAFNNLDTLEIGTGITSINELAFLGGIGIPEDFEERGNYGPNKLESVKINVSSNNL